MLQQDKPDETSWQKLYMYALVNRLLSESTESLELIKDSINYPCLSTKKLIESNRVVNTLTLPDGLYAIFTHKGSIDKISELYNAILNYWIPSSKYMLCAQQNPYVIYLNNSSQVAEKDLLSEIYIPLSEKSRDT